MIVATFGKRGVEDAAPEWQRREPVSTPDPDVIRDEEG